MLLADFTTKSAFPGGGNVGAVSVSSHREAAGKITLTWACVYVLLSGIIIGMYLAQRVFSAD